MWIFWCLGMCKKPFKNSKIQLHQHHNIHHIDEQDHHMAAVSSMPPVQTLPQPSTKKAQKSWAHFFITAVSLNLHCSSCFTTLPHTKPHLHNTFSPNTSIYWTTPLSTQMVSYGTLLVTWFYMLIPMQHILFKIVHAAVNVKHFAMWLHLLQKRKPGASFIMPKIFCMFVFSIDNNPEEKPQMHLIFLNRGSIFILYFLL